MARLTYDWPIGYDQDVSYDSILAPTIPRPTLDVTVDDPLKFTAAVRDTFARLETGQEVELEVEVDEP